MVTATDLAKSYGAQDVFASVNVTVPHGARIALVGPNGAGKTTLLRILIGQEDPSAGIVVRARGLTIGYLPQRAELDGERTLWTEMLTVFAGVRRMEDDLRRLERELADPQRYADIVDRYGQLMERFELAGGYEYEARIRQVLTGLGFEGDDLERPLGQLSGGQRTRALLARLLIEEPQLLVLDEPTNHLDIQAVEWLESALNAWKGALIAVSHDRYFMDRVTTQVWELSFGRLEIYNGNYSHYARQRDERHARQLAEYQAQQEVIAKTEEFIRRYKAGQKRNQAIGRQRRLERMERLERPHEAHKMRLHLRAQLRSGDKVLTTHDLVVGYPGEPLFQAPDLDLRRGEVAALIGPNGAGKTTFLRTVLGKIPPLSGEAHLGASVQVGYFAQAHEGLHDNQTLLDEILAAQPGMLISQARDYLARFLFTGDDVFKKIASLSGGERGRAALAILSLRGANFLLLDEPTNHLDIPAQEVLTDVLSDFEGTILLVSHDRYLIDALATQVWVLEGGELRVYEGDYEDYTVERAREAERQAEMTRLQQADPIANGRTAWEAASKASRQVEADSRRKKERLRKLQELEQNIAEAEARLARLSAALEQAGQAQQIDRVRTLGLEYNRVEGELSRQMDEWTALVEQE